MSFHPGKCHVLSHTRSKKPLTYTYTLHGQTLGRVPSTNYLGITTQDNGEWKEHINALSTKGNKLLGFLRRNMKISNKRAKQQAYQMMVRQPIECVNHLGPLPPDRC